MFSISEDKAGKHARALFHKQLLIRAVCHLTGLPTVSRSLPSISLLGRTEGTLSDARDTGRLLSRGRYSSQSNSVSRLCLTQAWPSTGFGVTGVGTCSPAKGHWDIYNIFPGPYTITNLKMSLLHFVKHSMNSALMLLRAFYGPRAGRSPPLEQVTSVRLSMLSQCGGKDTSEVRELTRSLIFDLGQCLFYM